MHSDNSIHVPTILATCLMFWPIKHPKLLAWRRKIKLTSPNAFWILQYVYIDSELFFHRPVPEGMKIQPVSEDYVRIVDSTWKFSGEHTEMFIRHLVEQHPSIVMTTDNGQHVGHLVGQSYGTMGMLYIQPEFRRKGYAKVIGSQLAQKYREMGDDLYTVVEFGHSASLDLNRFLNIKPLPNYQIAWMTFTPKECWKCKCASKRSCV